MHNLNEQDLNQVTGGRVTCSIYIPAQNGNWGHWVSQGIIANCNICAALAFTPQGYSCAYYDGGL